jgi:hypothetical protein
MTEEQEPDKKVVGGAGITAGGNVTLGDVTGQVATGEDITQIQSISTTDRDALIKSILDFQKGLAKLNLPTDDQNIVNGDISAAIKEVNKDEPDLSKIKIRFENVVNTIKEAGKTIKDISELYDPAKKISTIIGLGLALL